MSFRNPLPLVGGYGRGLQVLYQPEVQIEIFPTLPEYC
ncbi:hypothetical protein SBRY_21112 [Actinacidiphila bryophytorum]|uniref:Uncharacterized protein n=1 Tax=Actinacidiphila bryophytorum TaxID=1436133 RepID=A0A9W4E7J6_9ACTN|nr:hypothetical protein SBRY_21112 [Actinacidiphila bryophytorum]